MALNDMQKAVLSKNKKRGKNMNNTAAEHPAVKSEKKNKVPAYTRGEEIFNMVSHAVGAGFGIVALVLTVFCFIKFKDRYHYL